MSTVPLLTAAVLLTPLPAAQADSAAAGRVETAGCTSGTQWHLAYRMFFQNSKGGTLLRGAPVDRAKKELQNFVDRVGSWTNCEARVAIDLFDEGNAVYDDAYGPAESSWTSSHGYDSTMFRYPDQGDRSRFVGSTDYQNVKLPVTAADETDTYNGSPYFTTVIHEWLHVVWNQTQRSGAPVTWPRDDVHASFAAYENEGYDGAVRFYHDLVTGQYVEDGTTRGMKPGSWTATGTPTHYTPAASSSASPTPTASSSAGPTPTDSPAPDSAPSVSLDQATINAGERTTVQYEGQPGETLTILSKTQPATGYSVIGSVTLDASGFGTSSHAPTKNTRIEARTAGGLLSGQPLIQVRSVASFNANRVGSRTYTFTGRIYPARDQRLVSVYRNGALVAQARCDASGIYSVTRTLAAGTYSLQARTASDTYNLGATSRSIQVSIR